MPYKRHDITVISQDLRIFLTGLNETIDAYCKQAGSNYWIKKYVRFNL